MNQQRILLFGGNGQIGKSLQRLPLPPDLHLCALTSAECDFLNVAEIAKAIRDYGPDLVINSAALTDTALCEKDPDKARDINFHAVANIAGHCSTIDAPLIQVSTDYVFDGTENRPYGVDEPMNPLNVYGQTKMMGEEAARHGLYWHVIVRTSLVFSAFGNNILTRTLHKINTQDQVETVSDLKMNPTSAEAVAEGLLTIANAILHGKGNGFGTFHLSGEPAVSRFEFLESIMEAYAPYTDRRPKLLSTTTAQMSDGIKRPAYSVLDNDKIRDIYGIHAHSWRDDLARAVKEYVENRT